MHPEKGVFESKTRKLSSMSPTPASATGHAITNPLTFKWSQTTDSVLCAIDVVDPSNVKVNFGQDSFDASYDARGMTFSIEGFKLAGEIDPSKCRWWKTGREMLIDLRKRTGDAWASVGSDRAATKRHARIDFGRFHDASDDEGSSDDRETDYAPDSSDAIRQMMRTFSENSDSLTDELRKHSDSFAEEDEENDEGSEEEDGDDEDEEQAP